MADAEWLRQIVEGLIDNALRHAAGATRVRVGFAARDAGLGARITVADDGPGFPPEAEALFERFRRGEARGAVSAGFGIGLALARWVVERHDGEIRLETLPPATGGTDGRAAGARVVLDLPGEDMREDAA